MNLQTIVPWGRSFDEYQSMFALDEKDLRSKILGCGDGPSSFNKTLTHKGGSVVSVDPIYRYSREEIHQRILEIAPVVMKEVEANRDDYLWTSIDSPKALEMIRMSAMQEFLEDYKPGKLSGRYIEASLPKLSFENQHFNLVLCSHFLFLYSAQFDLDFHIQALMEMCRVGKEVRIFPLIDLFGNESPYTEMVIRQLKHAHYRCTVETVGYEFQKGGNKMLRVKQEEFSCVEK